MTDNNKTGPTQRIRLGWEMRADQLMLAIDILVVGLACLGAGIFVSWSGWLHVVQVLLILVGTILCLFDALRLCGWRSLIWPRHLASIDGELVDDSRKQEGFHVPWPELAGIGVVNDPNAARHRGTRVLLFPRSPKSLSANRIRWIEPNEPACAELRLPRSKGIAGFIAAAAPRRWQRLDARSAPGWDLFAKDIDGPNVPRAIPEPSEFAFDVGKQNAWNGILSGALAAFFGFSAIYSLVLNDHESTVVRVIGGIFGVPFSLIGLAAIMSVLVLVRPRQLILGPEGITWDDPKEESFTVAFGDLAAVHVSSNVVMGYRSSQQRVAANVTLIPRSADFATQHPKMAEFRHSIDHEPGRASYGYTMELGDQPTAAAALESGLQRFAPWLAVESNATHRPFKLK